MPASIEKRLSSNSSNEIIFKEVTIYYQDTLNKAGYKNKLINWLTTPQEQETKKTKSKLSNEMLYSFNYHTLKVSQRK